MNKGLLSVDEALATLLAGARPVVEVEQVPTMEAVGRVLAQAQISTMDVPPMDNSAMDGYAVRVADLNSPERKLKVAQRIAAGSVGRPLEPRDGGADIYRRACSGRRRCDRDAGTLFSVW